MSDKNPPSAGRYLIWALLAGIWLLCAAALVSYDAADWPTHQVYPPNTQPGNWVGVVGAVLAHKLYLMLGPGVWLIMTGMAAGLIAKAMRRPVDQLLIRAVGVAIVAITASAMIGLTMPNAPPLGSRPEGGGGLLAIFINSELTARFSTFGTMVILIVAFWVGAILAADQWVMAIPNAIGRQLAKLTGIRIPRPVLIGRWPFRWRRRPAVVEAGAPGGPSMRSPIPIRSGGRAIDDMIDEDAGGLGGVEAFDHSPGGGVALVDDDEEVEAEIDDEIEDDDDALAHDAPGAYKDEKKPFDPDALREKMSKMPIKFAPTPAKTNKGAMGGGAIAAVREVDLSGYQFPGLALLEEPEYNFSDEVEKMVRDQAVVLESALQQYRIEGEVVGIDSGPVITLFEVRLAPGTKVARINAVSSDVARALKVHSVRIVPTTAGKDTIGIEVPNLKKEQVRLKELMTASPQSASKMRLPMFLGKDASGNPLIGDLSSMPHMLIAGTTGSGKSVCMNAIIMSFLFTKRPDELKLVLVDPKMVEMSLFRDVPHLMCPVVTEMPKAAAILEWAVTKMDERYELLAEVGVRDIAGYNALEWDEIKERMQPANENEEARIPKKLPYMVFIVDELADLMMTCKEVEHFVVRIAQKARAVGIHLILATQRPQANVVTGLIKSNMPCRVSFKVASGMDSRIVLDSKGAEVLLGQGDMLYLSPRSSKLTRAQGSLVEDTEIRRVVKFLKEIAQQHFEPQLVQLKQPGAVGGEVDGERDELFDDAVRVVLESQRGSVSLLQRRLTIGYSRASRLVEQIAEAGIIGAYKGSQAREVNLTLEEWEAMQAQAAADANAGYADDDELSYEPDEDEAGDPGEPGMPGVPGVPDEYDDEYQS